jgi:hypothetical protein
MTTIPEAIDTLKAAMAADPDYAWGWHCNIAVPIMDAAGVSHKRANEAAAHLMQHLFDYDITGHPHYEFGGFGKSGAQQYAEMRIAADRAEDAEIARDHSNA